MAVGKALSSFLDEDSSLEEKGRSKTLSSSEGRACSSSNEEKGRGQGPLLLSPEEERKEKGKTPCSSV